MNRKGRRQTVFVCISATATGEIISMIIPAISQDDASKLFSEKYSHAPKEVHGPFYKKRTQVLETTRVLKFSDQTKKAIYNGWVVNAFMLKEPENQAYLVFVKREDSKSVPFPKGTIVVPISDLQFI
jgi:hypothetical protein